MRNVIFAMLCVVSTLCEAEQDFNRTNSSSSFPDKVLSRRKRYLIFPEGSSLQLVYCLTMPVIGKSTIFTIGGTAALAWELPHDPFQPYRKPAELLHRKDPPGKYTIKDPVPKLSISKAPQSPITYMGTASPIRYQRPTFVRPPVRFASINFSPSYNRYRYQNYRREQFPFVTTTNRQQQFKQPVYYRNSPQPAKVPVRTAERYYSPSSSSIYHQVHRRTRRDLYGKIEKFLSAQSKDGKACLLKAVCEVHQRGGEKGSFMEEIMKAVFRVKPFSAYKNEDVYDHAANPSHNCTELFPSCDSSILHFI